MSIEAKRLEDLAAVVRGIDYRQDTEYEIAERIIAAGWVSPEHLHRRIDEALNIYAAFTSDPEPDHT